MGSSVNVSSVWCTAVYLVCAMQAVMAEPSVERAKKCQMGPPAHAPVSVLVQDKFNHRHREATLDLASFDPDACIKNNQRVKMKFMSDVDEIDFEIKESLESNSPILKGKGYHGKYVIDSLIGSAPAPRGGASLAEGDFNMIEINGVVAGSAQVNGKIYHFQKNAFGDSVVKEFDTADLPPELEPQGTDQFSFSARRNLRPEEHSAEAWQRKLVEARYIDVLVPITRRAYCSISVGSSSTSCKVSGSRTDAVEAHIELAFFEANEALSASGVPGRVRLAHWYLLNDDTWDELAHSYVDIATNLPRLNNGFLDEVNVMRETHKADLVSIFIDDPSSCGLAYSGYPVPAAYGYSVINYRCAVGYYSFAHEIAHNLGAKHDRVTSNCSGTSCCGNDCDNFGYQDPESNYRSILAYNCRAKNCARVQMFSQPDYSLVDANGQSQPIGNEWNDNARVLINTWSTVADYYEGPYDTVVSTPVEAPVSTPVEAPVGAPVDTSTPAPTKAPATAVPETLCGNGICEPQGGENCETCALDCIGGTHWGSQCGNGWCEDGETCDSCPSDCPSRIDEATGNTFCCQGGPLGCIADGALGCNNNICWNNRGCSIDKAIEFSYCCGNGLCEPGEAVATCSDCVCVDDGVCETWEDTINCADCQNQDTAGYNCLEYPKVCEGVSPDPCCNGCGSNGRCI